MSRRFNLVLVKARALKTYGNVGIVPCSFNFATKWSFYPYPVTLLPIGLDYFRAKVSPVILKFSHSTLTCL